LFFSPKQIKQLEKGKEKIDGFTWHHHQDSGRMQLIPDYIHNEFRHVGGTSMTKGQ
jgi:hypothetical protein